MNDSVQQLDGRPSGRSRALGLDEDRRGKASLWQDPRSVPHACKPDARVIQSLAENP
jgi:hypothetical protein